MLSIVICVYNNLAVTRACLDSLRQHGVGGGMEVIVADDASTDETPQVIPQVYPWVRYLRAEANRGYGGTCTWAGLQAQGETLLLLNNDTAARDDFVSPLLARLKGPRTGMVAARLLYPDGTLQHGGVAFNRDKIPYHRYRAFPGEYPPAMKARSLQGVTGACIVIPRALFEKIEGFSPIYRNGMEDVDQCLRLRELGWDIWYEPQACLYHHESKSPTRHARNDQNQAAFIERWQAKAECDEVRLYEEDHFPLPLQGDVEKFASPETAEPCLPLLWETSAERRPEVEALAQEMREHYGLLVEIRSGTETVGRIRSRWPSLESRIPLPVARPGLTVAQTACLEALALSTPDALLLRGRGELREEYALAFAEVFPDRHEPQLLLGDWYWKDGQREKALEHYQRATAVVTPAYVARRMARCLLDQGRTSEAQAILSPLLQQRPLDLGARWLQLKARS